MIVDSLKASLKCFTYPPFFLAMAILIVGLLFYINRTKRPPKIKCVIISLLVIVFYIFLPAPTVTNILLTIWATAVGLLIYQRIYKCTGNDSAAIIVNLLVFVAILLLFFIPRSHQVMCYMVLFLFMTVYIGIAWYDEFDMCEGRLYPTGSFISRIQGPFKPSYYRKQMAQVD